ncbi:MAG: hypothetical protein Q7R84_03585 [bacterium]|nr:hypothetical protein [bacterium]
MCNKEALLEIGKKLAQVCRKTREKPSLALQYLVAISELAGFLKALELSGVISEEEAAEIARLALGVEEKCETPAPNIPGAFAKFIDGLNLDNL